MKISKANAEHYFWGNNCEGWKLVKNEKLSIIHEKMLPNTSEIRHYHSKARQFFFILKGYATIEIDEIKTSFGEYEGIEVPPNTPHQIFNYSDERIEFLVISNPSTQNDRIDL